MVNITAADVNKLRQMTGAGMMDCKKALQENEGDFEKAIDYLRKKGQKLATKRADKDANEGIVLARTNEAKDYAVVFMLNCETDFVAKNQEFVDFSNLLMSKAIENMPSTVEEFKALNVNGRNVEENITEMIGKTGEKMELAHFEVIRAPRVFAYNHPGNRLATILGLNKTGTDGIDQAGHEVAMQIAAMAPVAVDKDDVPAETIAREIEIGKEQARQEGKPEEMVEKIALGKLNKFYKESTLLNQEFVRDNKLSVGEYLRKLDKDLTVTGFKRFMLGA
ncbi:translation elongation factor Ts [Lentimicrobium sp.]|mgnify:CR=1 FL=1|jgi:elongation factor Ts|uniref:translation elongation factor Ts n=1 Tax=Lentimicrobium sp. TaxID=2034841 RepID=UPI0025FA4E92|nr:translation elongation factor Ts [Lentimicrobium sp.]MCO5256837.1 translation elongation factor Ts [Lentimicrobium sp.]HOP13840.1 translation elongation factor Ts [Lentimicrobium sp.]HPF64893.1 translation elongation factor Ts [Lentimicrobium sp.]HPJ61382.1 translation elongation factor Ts [Lentimicrobium sp.]HPR26188.1 translation elongation factor Ts [Lentimicrobium sp.]